MLLSAENIIKAYNGKNIIENVSITLNKGETVSLIGKSGVGKTTFFNVLSGLSVPESGEIYLADEKITGKTGHIGYMQQKDLLLPFKSVSDNVCVPLRLRGIPKKEALKTVSPLFLQFGLSGTEDKYPAQLSGGMRQRAALLRAYLFGSKVLLLDEPFSALDPITRAEIHDWFLKINKKTALSSFIITHDIDEAILLSDRIYVISGAPGKIACEITVTPPCERGEEFLFSSQFLEYKKQIMNFLS